MLDERLESIYEKYGGKAIYPALFLFFFLLHFLTSLGMYFPATDPNELGVIAVGEWFLGHSWSGVMCSVDYYYGFLQGLLYVPALALFGDPHVCYIAMLTTNALLISLVPLCAFACSRYIGVGRVWKSILISFVAGAYCCYFSHAKFAWSETASIVVPWLLLTLFLRVSAVRKKSARVFLAIILGVCCALSLGAHTRLIAIVLAFMAALIAQRIFCGKSSVPIVPFAVSFIACGVPVTYLSVVIQRSLWTRSDPAALNNTAEHFMNQIFAGFSAENGVGRFFITLFGQLYYFVTATWGAGAIAVCLFGVILTRSVQRRKNGEEQGYGINMTGFAFFMFFSVLFTLLIGTFYRFGSDNFSEYQDTTLFGRFLDGVIPFALMFVLLMLFTYSIELNKLLAASGILGVIYAAFFTATLPVILSCPATRIAPILALYPLQIGTESNSMLTFESLLLTASMTFCVMALFVVIVSCTKKLRSLIISLVLAGLTAYSVIFIQNEYLPLCRAESERKNAAVENLSESVYNLSGAPPITAYNISRHEALMLQFLNRNVTVRITYDIETIPENCYIVVKSDEDVSAFAGGRNVFLLLAERDGLRLYAYGDRAVAYMQSQDIGEGENETEPLMTEASTTTTTPETTTAPPETSTTTATTKAAASASTASAPLMTIADDDEWAVVE